MAALALAPYSLPVHLTIERCQIFNLVLVLYSIDTLYLRCPYTMRLLELDWRLIPGCLGVPVHCAFATEIFVGLHEQSPLAFYLRLSYG